MRQPFKGGIENLQIIFEMNSKQSSISAKMQGKAISKKDSAQLRRRDFFQQFVRLHGMIFLNVSLHQAQKKTTSTRKGTGPAPDMATQHAMIEQIMALIPRVLEEYDQLFQSSSFNDAVLIRLLVVSIFSVHFGAIRSKYFSPIILSTSSENSSTETVRTSAESLALTFLYGLISK